MKNDESIPTAALPPLRPGISDGAPRDGLPDLFPCERKLLHPETTPIPRPVRLRLNRLYRERICGF